MWPKRARAPSGLFESAETWIDSPGVDSRTPRANGASVEIALGERLTLPAFHQDQVVELPAGAEVLASSPFCPYAVLAYDDAGFSIQAHPEFSEAYQRDLIASRRGTVVPEAVADQAVASFDGRKGDSELAARWIGAFFRRHADAEQEAAE